MYFNKLSKFHTIHQRENLYEIPSSRNDFTENQSMSDRIFPENFLAGCFHSLRAVEAVKVA